MIKMIMVVIIFPKKGLLPPGKRLSGPFLREGFNGFFCFWSKIGMINCYYTLMSALIQNKKATLNYEILESFEAGIELFGFEVKSLRQKRGELAAAHITVRGGEAYLIGMQI